MDLNKAMIIGRLTREPENRSTTTGQSVSNFSLATNLVWTDAQGQKQERVEYHNIVAWRKLADICNQYLKKGSKVYVEGRLQTRSWQDQSGATKFKTEIIADNLIMLDSKRTDSSTFESQPQSTQSQPTQSKNQPQQDQPQQVEEEIRLEDIPF